MIQYKYYILNIVRYLQGDVHLFLAKINLGLHRLSAANSKLYRSGVGPNGFVLMNLCLGVGLTDNYTFGIILVPIGEMKKQQVHLMPNVKVIIRSS